MELGRPIRRLLLSPDERGWLLGPGGGGNGEKSIDGDCFVAQALGLTSDCVW